MILHSPTEEIKNRLDIVEVVSGYIKLQKAGRNFRARCPFHAEKTPSFMVSQERQIWHCFGCGKGGDIFGFVKEIEGVEFIDALRTLAQRAGVVLKKQDPKIQNERQRLYEICELAAKFFEKQLQAGQTGRKIEKYLAERGINKNSIKEWRLGYAPDGWEALSIFLRSRGYKDEEIIKSGVVVEKTTTDYRLPITAKNAVVRSPLAVNNYYDRFRDRIMFPIFDLNGQVVGFAGRVAPGGNEKSAKYINTPQTLIYNKGRILYGLDKAKMEIKAKNSCVLVEGNTDIIMSHQAGLKNAIASSGTALTEDHLKIIKRYTDNLILGFDMDIAGNTATKRTIDLALGQDFNVKIIQIGNNKTAKKKDPADIIRENPRQWEGIVAAAQGVVEFYFDDAFSRHDAKTANGKKEIAKIILGVLKKIIDPIEQAHWVQELSKKLKVSEKLLSAAISKSFSQKTHENRGAREQPKNNQIRNRRLSLEEEIMGLILTSVPLKERLAKLEKWQKENRIKTIFSNEPLASIFQGLISHLQKIKTPDKVNLEKWKKELVPEHSLYLNQISFNSEIRQNDPQKCEENIEDCLKILKKEIIKEKLEKLQYDIKEYEEKNDKDKLLAALSKFKTLSQELIS